MNRIAVSPSGKLILDFQINRDGSLTFNFVNEDAYGNETERDITGSTWEFFVKRYKGDNKKTISLLLGSGLSFPTYTTDEILAEFTATQTNIQEGEYYYELYDITNKQTEVSGSCYFNFDGQE